MAFYAVAATLITTAVSTAVSVNAAKSAENAAEAEAAFEKASTEKRVKEEQDRASQNLLRAQEEKRKELSKQRAAFIKAGVLGDSPSADYVIGALGDNLQTRIQDLFVQKQDQIHSISSAGSARHFNALQNASAAKYQQTGAIISGASSLASSGYKFQQNVGDYRAANAPKAIAIN